MASRTSPLTTSDAAYWCNCTPVLLPVATSCCQLLTNRMRLGGQHAHAYHGFRAASPASAHAWWVRRWRGLT